jgi:tripartite ATP-independent transporter DctM subunit
MMIFLIIVAGFVLLGAGVPITFAFGLCTIALALVTWPGVIGLNMVALNTYSVVTTETIIAVPLFVLMAEVIMVSGLGTRVFDAVQKLFWRVPGGLATSSMISSIGFAAITGSSVANTATIGGVAVKEMVDRKYDHRLSVGSIAAGGALAILIPPSTFMVIYGVVTNTSIVKLFLAGVIPGLMLGGMFIAYIMIRSIMNPSVAPSVRPDYSEGWILKAIWDVLPLATLALSMLGALYAGIATPNEVAAIGVVLATVIALFQAELTVAKIYKAVGRAIITNCMVFWIMIGTWSFGYILSYLGVGTQIAGLVQAWGVEPLAIILAINLLLLVLGCLLDPGAIVMLVMPLALPVLTAANIDLVWFGIIFTINMEMAMVTPPFGLNLFVMRGIAPSEVTTSSIIWGALPFVLIEMLAIALLTAFPNIALWLPSFA